MTKNFLIKYKQEFSNLLIKSFNEKKINKLVQQCKTIKKNKAKILIFGNGGSAAIANHFAVDMTKNAKIRTQSFSDSSLITCLANDYGHSNWVKKAVEFYSSKNDLIIFISSSGNSANIVNAAKYALSKKVKFTTFTGFEKNNKLSKNSKLNFWVNSKSYNMIENIHQIILLSVVDAIIGKSEYKGL